MQIKFLTRFFKPTKPVYCDNCKHNVLTGKYVKYAACKKSAGFDLSDRTDLLTTDTMRKSYVDKFFINNNNFKRKHLCGPKGKFFEPKEEN